MARSAKPYNAAERKKTAKKRNGVSDIVIENEMIAIQVMNQLAFRGQCIADLNYPLFKAFIVFETPSL